MFVDLQVFSSKAQLGAAIAVVHVCKHNSTQVLLGTAIASQLHVWCMLLPAHDQIQRHALCWWQAEDVAAAGQRAVCWHAFTCVSLSSCRQSEQQAGYPGGRVGYCPAAGC